MIPCVNWWAARCSRTVLTGPDTVHRVQHHYGRRPLPRGAPQRAGSAHRWRDHAKSRWPRPLFHVSPAQGTWSWALCLYWNGKKTIVYFSWQIYLWTEWGWKSRVVDTLSALQLKKKINCLLSWNKDDIESLVWTGHWHFHTQSSKCLVSPLISWYCDAKIKLFKVENWQKKIGIALTAGTKWGEISRDHSVNVPSQWGMVLQHHHSLAECIHRTIPGIVPWFYNIFYPKAPSHAGMISIIAKKKTSFDKKIIDSQWNWEARYGVPHERFGENCMLAMYNDG